MLGQPMQNQVYPEPQVYNTVVLIQPVQTNDVWAQGSDALSVLQNVDFLTLWAGEYLNHPALLYQLPNYHPQRTTQFSVRNKSQEIAFMGQKDADRLTTLYNSQNQTIMAFVPPEMSSGCPAWEGYCWCACCESCSNNYTIEIPGSKLGRVKQSCSLCYQSYTIHDETEQELFKFKKWNCFASCPCCMNSTLEVKDVKDGTSVAIINHFSANSTDLQFNHQMDSKLKALILAAMVLIYSYFYDPIEQGRGMTRMAAPSPGSGFETGSYDGFRSTSTSHRTHHSHMGMHRGHHGGMHRSHHHGMHGMHHGGMHRGHHGGTHRSHGSRRR